MLNVITELIYRLLISIVFTNIILNILGQSNYLILLDFD